MTKKQTLQAIFFDFDGVIVDSNSTKTEAFRILFSDYNDEIIAQVIAYHQQNGGISRVEKIRYAHQHIIKKPLTDEEVMEWAAEYSNLVKEKVIAADWIKGAKEFLDTIQGSMPIFVISGTPESELREVIERRNISRYFNEIAGSPTKKPSHIRQLLYNYHLAPEHCIFVGDALTDYNAARETGLFFIGIQGEVTFPERTIVLSDCTRLQEAISAHYTW